MIGEPDEDDGLDEAVRIRQERRELPQSERERSFAQNLAMIGVLGWTIVTPALVGIFAGRWIDHHLESGFFWTLTLFFPGLVLGCVLAWRRMGNP
jgi:ATP synthase protein I